METAEQVYYLGQQAAMPRINHEFKDPLAIFFDPLTNLVVPAGMPPALVIIFLNGYMEAVQNMRAYWKLAN